MSPILLFLLLGTGVSRWGKFFPSLQIQLTFSHNNYQLYLRRMPQDLYL